MFPILNGFFFPPPPLRLSPIFRNSPLDISVFPLSLAYIDCEPPLALWLSG